MPASLADDFQGWEQTAAFAYISVLYIIDGPKWGENSVIDDSTELQLVSVITHASEFAEVGPPSAAAFAQRLEPLGISLVYAGPEATPHLDVEEGSRVVCTQFARSGTWYCFKVPDLKGPPPGPPSA